MKLALYGDPSNHLIAFRGYLAPELIDKQQVSVKADIFSLGIIMINILTGRNGGNVENVSIIFKSL